MGGGKNGVSEKQKRVKSLHFRTLIHKYAEIANPLVELTKDKVRFQWNTEAGNAFCAVQKAIINNPTLTPPGFNDEMFLVTDGSKISISSILAQKKKEVMMPIEFCGRKLKESDTKYPSLKYELLVIHDSVKHFKNMLLGKKIHEFDGF